MNSPRQTRSFCFHETKLEITCSRNMAAYLDARFRMLSNQAECNETVRINFQAVADPNQHAMERPAGEGIPFYEIPKGEARYFRETDEIYLGFGRGVRALCRPRSGGALVSVVESQPHNLFIASHFVLTILLLEILRRRGWYSLHAAALSEGRRAILIAGTSGVGKSTLSIALLRAQFDYLSDDMVFLRTMGDRLVARGLVEDVDVSDETIRYFPELDFLLHRAKADAFPKRHVCPDEVYGTRLIGEAQPAALILPRISENGTSAIVQIDSDEALLEIVPNVLLTEEHTSQSHLRVLAELVKQTGCYRLDTGRDFARIPTLLRGLLGRRQERVCA